jgi:hypothetical protein
MTGLYYDKFQRHNANKGDKDNRGENNDDNERLNAKEVLERHNNNVGSFYNHPMVFEDNHEEPSMYDEMIQKLSKLMERNENGSNEDYSDVSGDPLSQVYYYSLTFILLYLLYKLLYTKKK